MARQTLSSFGKTTTSGNLLLLQTAGQSSKVNVSNNENLYLRQGFQQPPILSAIKNNFSLVNAKLFPNPNIGQFTILVETANNDNFNFIINDMVGAKIAHGTGKSNEPVMLSYSMAAGVYTLNIIQENQSIGQIKFIVY